MYIIVSGSTLKEKILSIIKRHSLPIFAYFCSKDDLAATLREWAFPISPQTIIFEECDGIDATRSLCANIKQEYPHISLGVILGESSTKVSMFRYLPESDKELVSPFGESDFVDFIRKLDDLSIPSISPNFICSHAASYLLGYDMKLSPSENRILVFLSTFNKSKLNANTICELCLNTRSDAGRIAATRVLINRINQKAKNISGRAIILNSYEKGYYINPEL